MQGSGAGPARGGPDGYPSTLRMGGPEDAVRAASLHTRLIAEGFLSSLGPRFLSHLYGRIVRCDGSFLLVAETDGTAIGFIAGSTALGRLYRNFLLRDGLAAVMSAPLGLVMALPRVLETLRHGRGGAGHDGAELLAVAVDPEWRGRHVGRQLVEGFLGELYDRGVGAARVVVGADNAAAIAMYRRSGFAPARRFEMHRGVPSVLMEATVPSASARPGQ